MIQTLHFIQKFVNFPNAALTRGAGDPGVAEEMMCQ